MILSVVHCSNFRSYKMLSCCKVLVPFHLFLFWTFINLPWNHMLNHINSEKMFPWKKSSKHVRMLKKNLKLHENDFSFLLTIRGYMSINFFPLDCCKDHITNSTKILNFSFSLHRITDEDLKEEGNRIFWLKVEIIHVCNFNSV